jgi:hypothetical protein
MFCRNFGEDTTDDNRLKHRLSFLCRFSLYSSFLRLALLYTFTAASPAGTNDFASVSANSGP